MSPLICNPPDLAFGTLPKYDREHDLNARILQSGQDPQM
jgi:hypothetical protein